LTPAFANDYHVVVVGSVTNLPLPYGGLVFKAGDPSSLLIGGAAGLAGGKLYAVPVQRDGSNHVTGFRGAATAWTSAPYNAGGLAYASNGVLLVARTDGSMGEIKPGSSGFDKVINLRSLGVTNTFGGLNVVPAGFPGAGQLSLLGNSNAQFYTATVRLESGTFNVTGLGGATQLGYIDWLGHYF